MASLSVQCPNCGAINTHDSKRCGICDTLLRPDARRRTVAQPVNIPRGQYEPAEGEDDLMVRGVWGTPMAGLMGVLLCLVLSIGLGMFVFYLMDGEEPVQQTQNTADAVDFTPSRTPVPPSPFPTNTRPAPPLFPTVTLLPPTDTPTPTPGPCVQTARSGDTVYAMALRCGHRDLGIVPLIVELNLGLECDTCLREGQTLEIPWPTPTPGDEPTQSDDEAEASDDTSMQTDGESSDTADVLVNEFGTPDAIATFLVEPTLRPGLAWHTIQTDQTLISLVQIYNTEAKVISDLNPQIEFLQCDFGERFGGPECAVMFFEGQKVRVPAPTGTPTLPPTPSGSETPTPSPSPTYNIPQAFAPAEDAYFNGNSLITMRWTASGTLASNEVYLITVRNLDRDRTYQARTDELFFVLPETWQPDGNTVDEFEWTVSIAIIDGNQITSTRQQTQPRRFEWQGR